MYSFLVIYRQRSSMSVRDVFNIVLKQSADSLVWQCRCCCCCCCCSQSLCVFVATLPPADERRWRLTATFEGGRAVQYVITGWRALTVLGEPGGQPWVALVRPRAGGSAQCNCGEVASDWSVINGLWLRPTRHASGQALPAVPSPPLRLWAGPEWALSS